jgi:hypothetical protein
MKKAHPPRKKITEKNLTLFSAEIRYGNCGPETANQKRALQMKQSRLTALTGFWVLAALIAAGARGVSGDIITYDFSGALDATNGASDPHNDWGGAFHNGESFTGTLTYDTATPSGPNGTDTEAEYVAYYPFNGFQADLTIDFPGGDTFAGSPFNDTFYITVDQGGGATFQDYLQSPPAFWQGAQAPGIEILRLGLITPEAGLDIPASLSIPENTGSWPFQLQFWDQSGAPAYLLGNLTSLTEVSDASSAPEPSTGSLMAGCIAALSCLLGIYPRRRRSHALASAQSLSAVRDEISKTSAASSSERPPKKRSSTS